MVRLGPAPHLVRPQDTQPCSPGQQSLQPGYCTHPERMELQTRGAACGHCRREIRQRWPRGRRCHPYLWAQRGNSFAPDYPCCCTRHPRLCAQSLALSGFSPCARPTLLQTLLAQAFQPKPSELWDGSEDSRDSTDGVTVHNFGCGFHFAPAPGNVLFFLLTVTVYSNILNSTLSNTGVFAVGRRVTVSAQSPVLVRQAPCLSCSQRCRQHPAQSLTQRRCSC